MKPIPALTFAISLLFVATNIFAANPAADNAADPVYAKPYPQWVNGDNGGFGFAPWILSPTNNLGNAGFFTATATQNGFYPSGGGIDTTSAITTNPTSWGLYANTNGGNNVAIAYRSFTGGSLAVGQTFSIGMDNGYVDADGGAIGFVLRNGNDTTNKNDSERFEVFFFGGGSDYLIETNAGSPAIDTGVGYTDGGLYFRVTLTGPDAFSCTVTGLVSGASTNINGLLGGTPGSGIDSVALYNQWAGTNQNYDLFFNSMVVGDFSMKAFQVIGQTNEVFTLGTASNAVYNVEQNTNLVSGTWSTLIANVVGTGGMVQLTNAVPASTPAQFYRLKLIQVP
jgi:hypothetical protein